MYSSGPTSVVRTNYVKTRRPSTITTGAVKSVIAGLTIKRLSDCFQKQFSGHHFRWRSLFLRAADAISSKSTKHELIPDQTTANFLDPFFGNFLKFVFSTKAELGRYVSGFARRQ